VLSLRFLKLLDDIRVAEEIERFKWIQSERLGFDIGKEKAALEWIRLFGAVWLEVYKPGEFNSYLEEISCEKNQETISEKYCISSPHQD